MRGSGQNAGYGEPLSPLPAPFPASGILNHPKLGEVRYEITEVSDDPDEQVAATVGLMRQYATEDQVHPALLNDVAQALRSDDALTDTWNYLRRNGQRGMQFVRDEVTGQPFSWRPVVETLMRPADQAHIANPQGDCDDFAMYGAAHLIARGVPCSFATVAADPQDPTVFSHIYLVAYPTLGPWAGFRVPLDLSHGPSLGWEVPNASFLKFAEWPLQSRVGLICWGLLAGGAYLLYRAARKGAF